MRFYFIFKIVMCCLLISIITPSTTNAYDLERGDYKFIPLEKDKHTFETPQLPDLKKYTLDAVLKKIPEKEDGIIDIATMSKVPEFWKFTKGRPWNVIKDLQQNDNPEAIIIQSGVLDIDTLYTQINNPKILAKGSDQDNYAYILKRPLYINKNATFIIQGNNTKKLRLAVSSNEGAFIINHGKLFTLHADIYAWDIEKRKYQSFVNKEIFRPFLLSIASSQTYLAHSIFRNLGYAQSKAYGISFSADIKSKGKPSGWIIDNIFEGIYYGFYSYEAEDVVILSRPL